MIDWKFFFDYVSDNAWSFLIDRMICLFNCDNERNFNLLNNSIDFDRPSIFEKNYRLKPIKTWNNNKFVIFLNVLNRTRITLTKSTNLSFWSKNLSNLVKFYRAKNRTLQLLFVNEKCLINANFCYGYIIALSIRREKWDLMKKYM